MIRSHQLNSLLRVLLLIILVVGSCSIGSKTPPAPIEDLSFDTMTRTLSWTTTGAFGKNDTATIYDLRFSSPQSTVAEDFANAIHIMNLPVPLPPGESQSFILPRIDITGTINFFLTLDVRNAFGHNSGPSNVVEGTTPLTPTDFQSASGSCFGNSVTSGDFNGVVNKGNNPFNPSATPSLNPSTQIEGIAIGDPCLGRVYIFFGGNNLTGIVDASTADVTIIGNAGDQFGASVAGLQNVGGDVSDDLAIGAPGFENGTGAVFIIFGSKKWKHGTPVTIDLSTGAQPDILITGESNGDTFGTAIVKLEGGKSPVLIGAPNAASGNGRAYFIFLKNINANTSASQAKAIFTGPSAGDMFGSSLANAGDFNNDSKFDFAVGAPEIGKVYIFFGQKNLVSQDLSTDQSNVVTLSGDPADGFGFSISGINVTISPSKDKQRGDITGDGKPDFIVGAPNSNNNTGSVFLYSGADIASAKTNKTAPPVITTFTGENPGDQFGTSLSILGDINPQMTTKKRASFTVLLFNPTNADFAVGAPGTSGGTGTVYLFFGSNNLPITVGATMADLTLNGKSPGEGFGTVVTGTGDFTTDFLNDFAVSGSSGSEFVREEY